MRMLAVVAPVAGAVVLFVSTGFQEEALSPVGNESPGADQEKQGGSRNQVREPGQSPYLRRIHGGTNKERSQVVAANHTQNNIGDRDGSRRQSKPVAALNPVSLPEKSVLGQSHHATPRNRAATGGPAAANGACAIQLSESFRLPAVMMARAMSVGSGTGDHGSPQIQDAMDGMIGRFYRDVACTPDSLEDMAGNATPDTKTIVPGPESDLITGQSNEQFRSLFGTEAYNRFSINSAIEVGLPPVESE